MRAYDRFFRLSLFVGRTADLDQRKHPYSYLFSEAFQRVIGSRSFQHFNYHSRTYSFSSLGFSPTIRNHILNYFLNSLQIRGHDQWT